MDERHDKFMELFLKNHASLYAFILSRGVRPDSAEDVLQNAASVLWQKFDTFQEGTNFKAWAFAVTRNEIGRWRDRQKRDARILCLDEETLESLETLEENGHEDLVDFQKSLLVECLEGLGESARRLLQLRYGDGLPFEEVARVLNKSTGGLRVQFCRIRTWLQNCVRSRTGEAQA